MTLPSHSLLSCGGPQPAVLNEKEAVSLQGCRQLERERERGAAPCPCLWLVLHPEARIPISLHLPGFWNIHVHFEPHSLSGSPAGFHFCSLSLSSNNGLLATVPLRQGT